MSLLFTLRGLLSRDADTRRLSWLLRRAPLREEHRAVLQATSLCAMKIRRRFRPGDRETIRVLFNLYSGKRVKVLA